MSPTCIQFRKMCVSVQIHKYLYRKNNKEKGAKYKQLVNLGKGYMADP